MKNASRLISGGFPSYANPQITMLVILRILIGWHFLYEGVVKILNPYWTSAGFLIESKWIFAPVFHAIVANSTLLHIVDFMNMWGLVAIGLGLITGTLTRVASVSGMLLLCLFALGVLTVFPSGTIIGIDRLIFKFLYHEPPE